MPDDNLKSYTCAIHCWERKRKQRQHNIKCSLFHVKTKLTENIQKAREQALEQKLCIETWVNIETFCMSPLTKWMDLKLFISNRSKLNVLISRETCSHEEKLSTSTFFIHISINKTTTIQRFAHNFRWSHKKVRHGVVADNTRAEKR